MTDLDRAVREHCDLYNASVASGDWDPFVATFTEDVEMSFAGGRLPAPTGRQAVAAAYARQPPSDTMRIDRVEPTGEDTVRAHFTWGRGGQGELVVRWRGDQVAAMRMS
jgi:steroid delta-isomerase